MQSKPRAGGAANGGDSPDDDGQGGLFDLAGQRLDGAGGERGTAEPAGANLDSRSPTATPPVSKARPGKTIDDKAGHRSRLFERFRNGGSDAMPDYELLEMILFRAIPRGDTKPAAKALLARFKTFAEVVNAPAERLMEVDGIGQRVGQWQVRPAQPCIPTDKQPDCLAAVPGGKVKDVCGEVVVPLVAVARLVIEPNDKSSSVTVWVAVHVIVWPSVAPTGGASEVGVPGQTTGTRLSFTVNGAFSVVLPVLRTR